MFCWGCKIDLAPGMAADRDVETSEEVQGCRQHAYRLGLGNMHSDLDSAEWGGESEVLKLYPNMSPNHQTSKVSSRA